MKILAKNKKALFNYEILKRYEAGIVLNGWEVKSIKSHNISLKESYITVKDNECFLVGAHVGAWPGMGEINENDFVRKRKLLLSKREINQLIKAREIRGNTIVVISCYEKKGRIKLEIGLAKGKKLYDKRAKLKEREQKRDIERDLKQIKYKI